MGVLATTAQDPLWGRFDQQVALAKALASARAGDGAVLVLRGEAGVGKSRLLHYAEAQALEFLVLKVSGAESEKALPYASLQQLCWPLLSRIPDLPAPQGEALSVAFGILDGEPASRFLVGLAVLGLLDTEDDRPLVLLVDDAHWLDETSMRVLVFVARRMAGRPMALLVAGRQADDDPMAGLPQLPVRGLTESDARALLMSAARVPLDPLVRERIIAEAHGNPTDLLRLPHHLAPAELAGGFWLPEADSSTSRVERVLHERFRLLPRDSRQLLATAAAEPTGDVGLLFRAAAAQGISPVAAAVPAEASGLVEFGTAVRFRHARARTAIYRRMSLPERREVHLRSAYETFSRAGATGFAERSRRELAATGDHARERAVGTDLKLTRQERQIATLAGEGNTNGEIATRLFISPRTVEWHLGNVFAKLGVSSRRHLPDAIPPA